MEDFYKNITSQNNSYDYSNITYSSDGYWENFEFIDFVVRCITTGISLPLTLVAIYALYCQVQNDHVAPIYIINLLISDLIQLCCLIVEVAPTASDMMKYSSYFSYIYGLMVSVGFMVCIALERYLVVAHPLWYRFRRTIKISVGVSVLVWVLPLVFVLVFHFWIDFNTFFIIFGIFLLLPLPLFIFFLGGTLKILSTTHVPADEKRRIVAVLVLVLLIYTLLFLPAIIYLLSAGSKPQFILGWLSRTFVHLSPLADLTLYVFMRKGIVDKLLSSVCCCRMDSDDTNSSSA